MEATDVSTALDKITALPGVSKDKATRDAIQAVLEDLRVDARHEGTQVGPDPDALS